MPPHREPRLVAYALVAIAGLALGLLTTQGGPIIVAAPFVAALLVGLRSNGPLELRSKIEIDSETVIEGDICDLRVVLQRPQSQRLLVHFEAAPGTTLIEPANPVWDIPPGTDQVNLALRLRADEWGKYQFGRIWVEASLPAGLVRWQGHAGFAPSVRVLPHALRLQQLLDPPAMRVAAGEHRSSLVGDGTDFAEVRPFVAGDRLRNLNWHATARLGAPHVNRHHPDRASEIMLLVDTFGDEHGQLSIEGREAIARCARAAWTISRRHLAAQDRVGLCMHGRVGLWLAPDSGDRARYRLLDAMLQVGGARAAGSPRDTWVVPGLMPPDTVVVALTALWDRRMHVALRSLQMRGHDVIAVIIDTTDVITEDGSVGRHLWRLMLDERRRDLRRAGIPEVLWSHDSDLNVAINRLRSRHRPHLGRRAMAVRR